MKKFWSVLVFFPAVLLCTQLEAAAINDCMAGSLESYMGSSCVLGEADGASIIFSGFTFAALNPDSAPVLDASQIELNPIASGLSGSFDFSGEFSVPAGDTVTYDIDYLITLDPAPILGGGSLFLDPRGDVSVTESICADSAFGTDDNGNTVCEANGGNGGDSTPQSLSVDTSHPSASIILDPAAYTFANVDNEIVLTGGTEGASSKGVVVGDSVTELPEPVTSLLCLGGLTAIGVFRRRFIA